ADPRPNYPAVDVSCSVLTRPSLPDLPHTFSFSHATATTEIYTLSLHDALAYASAEATRHRTQGSFHGFPGKPVKEDRRRATDSRRKAVGSSFGAPHRKRGCLEKLSCAVPRPVKCLRGQTAESSSSSGVPG